MIIPYLIFNGNCREAVNYYTEVFKTEKPQIMAFGDMPGDPSFEMPEGAKNLVMHAELEVSSGKIMFSDNFPGTPFTQGNNVNLTIVSKDEEFIKTSFNKLKDGGTVEMELQETFWSKLYGSLTDKFGIVWQLSLDSERNE